jgi:hypothetical protein
MHPTTINTINSNEPTLFAASTTGLGKRPAAVPPPPPPPLPASSSFSWDADSGGWMPSVRSIKGSQWEESRSYVSSRDAS